MTAAVIAARRAMANNILYFTTRDNPPDRMVRPAEK